MANVLGVTNSFRALGLVGESGSARNVTVKGNRVAQKVRKLGGLRKVSVQDWDSKRQVKLAVPGAGRYVVSRHVSLE